MRGPRKDDPEIAKKAWNAFCGFINAQASLTFYTRKDIREWLIDWQLSEEYFYTTLAPRENTQQTIQFVNQLKQHAKAIFFRSVGAQGNVVNERTAQASSIIHHISTANSMGMRPGGGSQGGFLNNLRSLLR